MDTRVKEEIRAEIGYKKDSPIFLGTVSDEVISGIKISGRWASKFRALQVNTHLIGHDGYEGMQGWRTERLPIWRSGQ